MEKLKKKNCVCVERDGTEVCCGGDNGGVGENGCGVDGEGENQVEVRERNGE